MIIRSLKDAENSGHFVEWGGGTSHRLLTDADTMGFSICHTVVHPGTQAKLQYHRHLEACYCIAGHGQVIDISGKVHQIIPGTVYILDQNDAHTLCNDGDADFVLVSVFNPPLSGREIHDLSDDGYSGY